MASKQLMMPTHCKTTPCFRPEYVPSWERFRTASKETDLIVGGLVRLSRKHSILTNSHPTILDIGCGDAAVVCDLVQRLRLSGHVHLTLVDPVETMMSRSRKRVDDQGLLQHTRLLCKTIEEVLRCGDLDKEHFDLVILSHVLYYLEPSILGRIMDLGQNVLIVTNKPDSIFVHLWDLAFPELAARVRQFFLWLDQGGESIDDVDMDLLIPAGPEGGVSTSDIEVMAVGVNTPVPDDLVSSHVLGDTLVVPELIVHHEKMEKS